MLEGAGFDVRVLPVSIDEAALAGESVPEMVLRLAREKADACPCEDMPIVAADTMVCLRGSPLGKPMDLDDARRMLRSLAGWTHQVYTGVCVRLDAHRECVCICTDVRFRPLKEEEIEAYLRTHEVLDKAGAYALQEGAASFIDRIDGPLDNVIGLPVAATCALLARLRAGEPA